MSGAPPPPPPPATATRPTQALLALTGLAVALASGYELLVGCRACQASATGMPPGPATVLAALGTGYGVALLAVAAPGRGLTPRRLRLAETLVLGGVTLGAALLLGVVSGAYRFCPVCVGVWSAVGLAALGIVGLGGEAGRRMTLVLVAFTLAAAWTRFDRTTAQGLAALLPRADPSEGCIADVLTPEDLQALARLGVPERVPVLFVAQCSPCAAAAVGRILAKTPDTVVVAADATPTGKVGAKRLVVYPLLAARAARLGANLHRAVLRGGRITECKPNVTALD